MISLDTSLVDVPEYSGLEEKRLANLLVDVGTLRTDEILPVASTRMYVVPRVDTEELCGVTMDDPRDAAIRDSVSVIPFQCCLILYVFLICQSVLYNRKNLTMGIKKLFEFIRENCPYVIKTVELREYKGKRMAIDASGWLYANLSMSYKEVVERTDLLLNEPDRHQAFMKCLRNLMEFILSFLKHDVIPVFVFDGKPPAEKSETKQERAETRQKIKDKIRECKSKIDQMNILEKDNNTIKEYRTLLSRDIGPQSNEIQTIQTLLTGIGIPWIQAIEEAEQVCSVLCIEGKVDVVFSEDGDNLVYGCPTLALHFERSTQDEEGNWIKKLAVIHLSDLLEGLNLSYDQFMEFCILSKCDYNKNIPNLGISRVYALLHHYGRIKNIPKTHDGKWDIPKLSLNPNIPSRVYDTECLRLEFCLKQFNYTPSNMLYSQGTLLLNKEISEVGKSYLDSYGLAEYVSRMSSAYYRIKEPDNICVSRPPRKSIVVVAREVTCEVVREN